MRSPLPSLVLIAALGVPAAADPPSADALAQAKAHAHRATQLYDLGKYVEAAQEYEQSFALSDRAPLLFNIAQAYRLANKRKEAIAAYRGFVRRMPESPLRAEAQRHVDDLEKAERQDEERARAERDAAQPEAKTRAESDSKTPPLPLASTGAGASATSPPGAEAALSRSSPPRKRPVYKQWWLWTAVGVAAAGVGVALGVTLTQTGPQQTNFPVVAF